MLDFGSGVAVCIPSGGSDLTPQRFGNLQDISLDFSFTTKQSYGRYSFPIDVARCEGKFTGKAKTATFNGPLIADLFFGTAATAGQLLMADLEAGTIPAPSGPYTVVAANATTFKTDLGVSDALGNVFSKVASGPTTGQYSVNASTGTYTFAAADAGKAVLISYSYTSTAGKQIAMTNQYMGTTPYFTLFLANGSYQGKQCNVWLNKVTSNKLSFPRKMNDYVIPEFDLDIMTDASNSIGTWSFAE